jgi:predicted Zn-dependent protease
MRSKPLCILAVSLAALAAAGCASVQTTQAGAVGVERKQTMLVSSREVNQAATQQYSQVIAQAQQKQLLNRDPAQVARVRGIATRLIAQTGHFRNDAPGWRWEVNVITSSQLNAWCMPGGKMAVYTGLIEKLKLSDAELAAVMGHEIAHSLREHGRERVSQQLATNAVVAIGAAALGLGDAGATLGNLVAQVTFTLPNSRTHEMEADRIGVELAARAGYDPRGAVTVWQKMAQATDGGTPQFLSTHPSPENRIRDLEVYAQRVQPLYDAARR